MGSDRRKEEEGGMEGGGIDLGMITEDDLGREDARAFIVILRGWSDKERRSGKNE